jgi:hypothetical protein
VINYEYPRGGHLEQLYGSIHQQPEKAVEVVLARQAVGEFDECFRQLFGWPAGHRVRLRPCDQLRGQVGNTLSFFGKNPVQSVTTTRGIPIRRHFKIIF